MKSSLFFITLLCFIDLTLLNFGEKKMLFQTFVGKRRQRSREIPYLSNIKKFFMK
jgi:hypothetical protein